MRTVEYVEAAPHEELAPWIERYRIVRRRPPRPGTPPAPVLFAPDACTQLLFRDGSARIVGPRTKPGIEPAGPDGRELGVRFRPGAARAFLQLARLRSLRDDMLEAAVCAELAWIEPLREEVARPVGDEEAFDRLDRALRARAAMACAIDPLIRLCVATLCAPFDRPTVESLAKRVGLSIRQLRRRFRAAVDLSPKQFAGISRFRRCASAAVRGGPATWADRAAEHGYSDQSHLNREFRRLAGFAPGALARGVAPAELWLDGLSTGATT